MTNLTSPVFYLINYCTLYLQKRHFDINYVYVVVSFLSQVSNFSFSFVSTSLAYITIPKNKRKTKIA